MINPGRIITRDIRMLVIHCSDTYSDMDIGVEEIQGWHTWPRKLQNSNPQLYQYKGRRKTFDELPHEVQGKSGRGWLDIGYHEVIRRNGQIEFGRDINVPGAHARGFNAHSIGLCMIGGKAKHNPSIASVKARHELIPVGAVNFTLIQWATLGERIAHWLQAIPDLQIVGHNQLSNNKTCPNFFVEDIFSNITYGHK